MTGFFFGPEYLHSEPGPLQDNNSPGRAHRAPSALGLESLYPRQPTRLSNQVRFRGKTLL